MLFGLSQRASEDGHIPHEIGSGVNELPPPLQVELRVTATPLTRLRHACSHVEFSEPQFARTTLYSPDQASTDAPSAMPWTHQHGRQPRCQVLVRRHRLSAKRCRTAYRSIIEGDKGEGQLISLATLTKVSTSIAGSVSEPQRSVMKRA